MLNKPDSTAACWPSGTQELLLKAVLLKDEKAHAAWQQWLTQVDFFEDSLSGGSYHLLPLLYKNFQALGLDDPLLGRLKGIVRNTWTRNQIQVQNAVPVLAALGNSGIQTLLLHGAALVLATYSDYSSCLLNAFDIYVSPLSATGASSLILQTGVWSSNETAEKDIQSLLCRKNKLTFQNNHGQNLNLHWHLPILSATSQEKPDFLDHTVPFHFQNVDTYTLYPTDQVLALCLDGLLINRILAVDWIAHVAHILNQGETGVDWQRLIALAQSLHLVLAVRNTLHYVVQTFNVAIPTTQLKVLDNLAVSQLEKKEWRVITNARSGYGSRYQRLRRLWYGYMRVYALSSGDRFNPMHLPAFYHYLRQ